METTIINQTIETLIDEVFEVMDDNEERQEILNKLREIEDILDQWYNI